MERGNKLWDGYRFMNPLYNDRLYDEKPEPLTRPELDEQQLAQLDHALERAINTGFRVSVTVYDPTGLYTYEGCIRGVAARSLLLETVAGIVRFPLEDVLTIEEL